MGIGKVISALLCGAATAAGSIAVTKMSKVLGDPDKKDQLKKSLKDIKNTFCEKKET